MPAAQSFREPEALPLSFRDVDEGAVGGIGIGGILQDMGPLGPDEQL